VNLFGLGPLSAPSIEVTPVGLPGAPTSVVATRGNASASLTWNAPASDGGSPITGYEVLVRQGTTVLPAGPPIAITVSATTATATGLSNGTAYNFQVRAVTALGAGALATSNTVTPATVPDAPVLGAATASAAATTTGSATVSWTAPFDGGSAITSYQIVATPTTGAAVTRTGIASTATTGTVTGLVNGTSYALQVRAVNALGSGLLSAASTPVTPTGLAGAPTAVVAVRGSTQASLSWTAPAADGGSAITGWTVQVRVGATVVRTDTITGSTPSTTITGLTNGTAYNFRVAAVNAHGTGAVSASSNTVTPATTPGAPVLGAVTQGAVGGALTVTVNWTPPASNGGSAITSYTVSAYNGAGNVAGLVTLGSAARAATLTFTTTGPFTFDVNATNAVGTGPASAASATTSAR